MNKKSKPARPRHLDKQLFEAGQQCLKRLWLDHHEPAAEAPSAVRQEMSKAGDILRELARSAFPKGVAITAEAADDAAAETQTRLAEGAQVLFGATFVADGVEARCDILVVHRTAAANATDAGAREVDLFEIKSGTKVKPRYVNDLALQAMVLARCGMRLRAAFLLHVNPRYVHKEGAEFPPMQLLRSADVTAKVQKQLEPVQRRVDQFQKALANPSVLELPVGTFCTQPFPCPHLARCLREAPPLPLRELPELTRKLEIELHKEGIEDLTALDAKRPGLTFRQRRALASVQQNQLIVEPFVNTELLQCTKPLHFLAMATVTDPLPRFDDQRPWRSTPYAWSAHTVHPDGRLEVASFVHVDRTDPRQAFATSLAKHLEVGGTILCWGADALGEVRGLLDDLPSAKAAVRALLSRPHLDMMRLFESGVFHPQLRSLDDLRQAAAALLDDHSGSEVVVFDEESLLTTLQRAQTPRARSATKEKVAGEIKDALAWHSERLLQLYGKFAQVEPKAPKSAPTPRPRAAKPLPRLPE